MAEESFLLVSLSDEKSKKLSQVISNDTARRILELLSRGKSTESEIARELAIPISTAHYNIAQLLAAGLVRSKEYHYSKKGKEVNHYELANKLIIISPGKEKEGLIETLKKFLPVSVLAGAVSMGMHIYQGISKVSEDVAAVSAPMAMRAIEESVPKLAADVPEMVAVQAGPNYALWFFIGSFSVILAMMLSELIRRKKR